MEKILSIKEIFNHKVKDQYSEFDGFEIETDKQKIYLLISNSQCCCESFGHFCSNDDFSEFIGAEIKEITKTDTALSTKVISDLYIDEGDTMFVNLETSKGTLQFAAYNSHNGYYGHSALFISEQLKLDETL